jgi:WD40 repeat protein
VILGEDEDLVACDIATGTQRQVAALSGLCCELTITPEGHIATYSNVAMLDNTLECFSWPDGELVEEWESLSPSGGWVFRFSPDGRRLALPSYMMLCLFDLPTRTLVRQVDLPHHCSPPFSPILGYFPDGSRLLYGSGRELRIAGAETLDTLVTIRQPRRFFRDATVHPFADMVATVSGDSIVTLWDASTGTVRNSFDWEAGALFLVAFSPDGMLGAAAGASGYIIVWDVDVG